jgi:hypothetical protein
MSRHTAALRALLAIYRIDTAQKTTARLAPPLIGLVVFAWLFPTEFANHWGKAAAVAIAYVLVVPIIYVWTLRTLPDEAKPLKAMLSPLYTPVGRKQFRSEQRAKDDAIAQLSGRSGQLAAEMAKLDITTEEGQRKLQQLAAEKKPIDQKLADLEKLPKLRLGYVAGD